MWGVWIPVSDEKHLAEIMMRTLRDRNPPMEMVVMQLNPKVPQATPCARCKYIRLDCEPLPGYTCFKQAAPPLTPRCAHPDRDGACDGALGCDGFRPHPQLAGKCDYERWEQAAPPAQQPPYERCAVWLAGNCPFDSRPCDGCSWFQPREGAV